MPRRATSIYICEQCEVVAQRGAQSKVTLTQTRAAPRMLGGRKKLSGRLGSTWSGEQTTWYPEGEDSSQRRTDDVRSLHERKMVI